MKLINKVFVSNHALFPELATKGHEKTLKKMFRLQVFKSFVPFRVISWLSTFVVLAMTFSCNYRGNLSGIHWFLDMHDNLAVEAQEEDPLTLDLAKPTGWWKSSGTVVSWGGPGSSIRIPPEGSVPRNFEPYPYEESESDLAGEELANPLPRTRNILERGQKEFNIYCSVCHGRLADGHGSVAARFPTRPPNLVAGPARDFKDGKIFHLITIGRASMKPFAAQIQPADRWAIVHYLRALQANTANQ